VTAYATASCRPKSKIERMFGWERAATALASRSKRASASSSFESRAGSTFTATSRASRASRARKTSPIPTRRGARPPRPRARRGPAPLRPSRAARGVPSRRRRVRAARHAHEKPLPFQLGEGRDPPGPALEGGQRLFVLREPRGEYLHGDVACEPRVTRTKNLSHSPG